MTATQLPTKSHLSIYIYILLTAMADTTSRLSETSQLLLLLLCFIWGNLIQFLPNRLTQLRPVPYRYPPLRQLNKFYCANLLFLSPLLFLAFFFLSFCYNALTPISCCHEWFKCAQRATAVTTRPPIFAKHQLERSPYLYWCPLVWITMTPANWRRARRKSQKEEAIEIVLSKKTVCLSR